jgi:hypothetical protein
MSSRTPRSPTRDPYTINNNLGTIFDTPSEWYQRISSAVHRLFEEETPGHRETQLRLEVSELTRHALAQLAFVNRLLRAAIIATVRYPDDCLINEPLRQLSWSPGYPANSN